MCVTEFSVPSRARIDWVAISVTAIHQHKRQGGVLILMAMATLLSSHNSQLLRSHWLGSRALYLIVSLPVPPSPEC